MEVNFSTEEVETLLESLKYSKDRISSAQGTPLDVRKQNLEKIENAEKKVRQLRDSLR